LLLCAVVDGGHFKRALAARIQLRTLRIVWLALRRHSRDMVLWQRNRATRTRQVVAVAVMQLMEVVAVAADNQHLCKRQALLLFLPSAHTGWALMPQAAQQRAGR
jgi:hypothetical protein